jgi:O-antigen/teichoic acid export membrane protein
MSGHAADPTVVAEQTAAHRAARDRRSATATWTAIVARVIGYGASFVAIPLTIGYLGIERYGLLVSLTAVTSMLVFADLGLGNGLLNLVSDAQARDDRQAVVRAVSSAFFTLAGVAIAIGAIAALVLPAVSWSTVFSIRDRQVAAEAGPAAAILIGLFLAGIPLGIVERTRLAFQEAHITSLIAIAAAVGGLAALVVAIGLRAPLPVLVGVIAAPPVIGLAASAIELFRRRRPWLTPSLRRVDRKIAVRLVKLGSMFLVLQLAVALAYQSDVVVAGVMFGPAAAATYAVTLKFALLAPSIVALFLATLWPAYTEALARGDVPWVRRTLRRSILIAALVSGVASLGFVIAGGWVIGIWTDRAVEPPGELLIGAALWAVVYATSNAVGMLMNAASVIAFQVMVAAVMAISSVTLSVILANVFGLPGIVWGTLIAYVLCSGIPIVLYLPRLLRTIELRSLQSARPSGGSDA